MECGGLPCLLKEISNQKIYQKLSYRLLLSLLYALCNLSDLYDLYDPHRRAIGFCRSRARVSLLSFMNVVLEEISKNYIKVCTYNLLEAIDFHIRAP